MQKLIVNHFCCISKKQVYICSEIKEGYRLSVSNYF